jgi:DNA-binding MarR family transcriptional regulator
MHFDINRSITLKLSNTLNTIRKVFNKAISDYNISSEQYAILKLISEKELTPTDISNIVKKDRAAITRFINTLEKKGLIEKKTINKRSYKILVTKKGKELIKEIDKKAIFFRKEIEKEIPKEKIDYLFEILGKIENIVERLK